MAALVSRSFESKKSATPRTRSPPASLRQGPAGISVSPLAARRIDCLFASGSAAAVIARANGAANSAFNSSGAAEQEIGGGVFGGGSPVWKAFIQNTLDPTKSTAREMLKIVEERIEAPNT